MRIYDPQFQCDATGQVAPPQWLGDGDLEDDRVEDVPGLDAENLPHSWTEVRFTTKRPNPTHEPAMASWRSAQQTWARRIGEAVRASVMEGAARKLQRPMTDPDVEAAALEDLQDPGMVAEVRFTLTLLAAFGLTGLMLAGVGLYGLLSHSVRQGTGEIGLRVALGAGPGGVLRLVLTQGLRLTAIGVVVGMVAAAIFSRVLESQLFGVSAHDPLTFAGMAALMAAAAAVACGLPALRALRIDPLEALRTE